MNERLEFFTIVSINYLAQAYVLGESVKAHHPEAAFYVFLMDDIDHKYEAEIKNRGLLAVYPEQVGIPRYRQFVFKYNIVEACTGVKPFVIRYLLELGGEKIIYLDPDILCFRALTEVIEALNSYAIVITPHSLSPILDSYSINDQIFLIHGAYNIGFIGISRRAVTLNFLEWWMRCLFDWCLERTDNSLFVDQKWVDLVPSYFDSVLILRNPAYNIAYWNLHERILEKKNGIFYVANSKTPVVFIHYSGMDVKNPAIISKNLPPGIYSFENRPDLVEPFNLYAALLESCGYQWYSSIPYAFSKYLNGELISPQERQLFRESPEWQRAGYDPFQTGQGSFWEFCRKMGLNDGISNITMKKTDRFTIYAVGGKILSLLLKSMVKILGVDRYSKFIAKIERHLYLAKRDFIAERKKNRDGSPSK